MEKRLEEIKEKLEIREREERKNNIVVKGIEVVKRKIEEAVREVIREIEVVVNIEEVRKVGEKDKKKKGVVDEKAAK